jgi:hypothetical protein
MMGLEPTTLGTTNRCSNQLSYIYRFGECKNRNLNAICKGFFLLLERCKVETLKYYRRQPKMRFNFATLQLYNITTSKITIPLPTILYIQVNL